ncbi:MAG: hypothetical protein IPI77_24030 [Saprospiraceae bacterium]|nr:hypothetical protein [Saprospiraceae bacterium]
MKISEYHYIVNIEDESKGWSLAADKIKALPGATAARFHWNFAGVPAPFGGMISAWKFVRIYRPEM